MIRNRLKPDRAVILIMCTAILDPLIFPPKALILNNGVTWLKFAESSRASGN